MATLSLRVVHCCCGCCCSVTVTVSAQQETAINIQANKQQYNNARRGVERTKKLPHKREERGERERRERERDERAVCFLSLSVFWCCCCEREANCTKKLVQSGEGGFCVFFSETGNLSPQKQRMRSAAVRAPTSQKARRHFLFMYFLLYFSSKLTNLLVQSQAQQPCLL